MIDIQNLSYDVGSKVLFENVTLKINPNDKIALVGLNGAGKSTFLKLITGLLTPASGKINKSNKLKIGYLPQEFLELKDKPLFEEVSSALENFQSLIDKEKLITSKLQNNSLNETERNYLIKELGKIHHRQEETGFFGKKAMTEKILTGLGFTKDEFEKNINEFSGGWQMRAELAKILLNDNNIILLDEPTNHLDMDSLRWVIKFLKNYNGALVIISHDKYFLNEVTEKTFEVWNRNIISYNGKYSNYINYKKQLLAQKEAELKTQRKKIKETEKFIERFRYKASKASQVQSRIKQLEKIKLEEIPVDKPVIKIKFPDTPRGASTTVKLENISAGYGNNVVIKNLNLTINRGDKLALVGKNGEGKSTLAKIAAGKIKPFGGNLVFGQNIFISHFAQEITETLNLDDDLITALSKNSSELTQNELRNILGAFLFSGDDIFKKVRVLSGGEKSRLALASVLVRKSNFIILDEPTNHLDLISKEILQSALVNFNGSLLIISHDIDFLKPIVNKVIEFQNGRLINYSGGIDYYLTKKESEAEVKINGAGKDKKENTNPRKNQKRLAAEKRQKRYEATKEIKDRIKIIEKDIKELELKIETLEKELSDLSLYKNAGQAKTKTNEYNEAKNRLNLLIDRWVEANEELESIEDEFN